jgi:VWFA-related protein
MSMKIFRSAGLALAAAVLLSPVSQAQDQSQAPSQDQPQGQFGEKVNVQEVLLDVLVTDAKGNVIVGLGPDDFVVREDGKPVNVTGVSFYSNRNLVEPSAQAARKGLKTAQAPEDRYFILFFDDQKSNAVDAPELLTQQMQAVQRARDWVSRELLPNDWVAVVSYDQKLKVQQDFTHDRKALAAAVSDAMKSKDHEGNWPSRVAQHSGPSIFAGLPRGNELREKTGTIYDAVNALARSAGNITGRKNLLLFSNGFGNINSFGQYVPDERYYPKMVHTLNDNNVAVYPIDLVPQGTQHTMTDGLNQLASDTGGRYFFNFTNFLTPLKQVAQENSGYYLLSYSTERPTGASGYQEVQVKAANPEFKVRARKGYEFGK